MSFFSVVLCCMQVLQNNLHQTQADVARLLLLTERILSLVMETSDSSTTRPASASFLPGCPEAQRVARPLTWIQEPVCVEVNL